MSTDKVKAWGEKKAFNALTWLIDGDQPPVVDPTSFQYQPTCDLHIGQRPWREPQEGEGLCEGCWLWLPLERGRIPNHAPGPPPFVRCPYCLTPYPRPSYNEPVCDDCAIEIEEKHQQRIKDELDRENGDEEYYDDDEYDSSHHDESEWA